MERRERCEISRGDRTGPGPKAKIAGKLSPPCSFKPKILTGDNSAAVGQARACLGKMVGQLLHRRREHRKRQVVLAKNEPVRLQVVHGAVELFDLRCRLVAAAEHLVLLAVHDGPGIGLGDEREGLRQDQLERAGQNAIQHAGPGGRGILLETQHSGKAALGLVPDLDRLAADNDAVRIDRRSDAAFREGSRLPSSADELVKNLAWLGEQQPVMLVKRQDPRLEPLQARRDVDDLVTKLLQRLLVKFDA